MHRKSFPKWDEIVGSQVEDRNEYDRKPTILKIFIILCLFVKVYKPSQSCISPSELSLHRMLSKDQD